MKNKNFIFRFFGVFSLLILFIPVVLFFPAVLVKAGSVLSPQPPPIGQIRVIGTQGSGNSGRTGNVNKVGANDKVFFQILDNQGQPYPSTYIYVKDGQPQYVAFSVKLDLRMGNGTVYSPFYADYALGEYSIPVISIRQKKLCQEWDSGNTQCFKNAGDLMTNPLIPGDVYVNAVTVTVSSGGEVLATQTASPNIKLFTIPAPPFINLNKSSASHGETVTISGSNFDAFGYKGDVPYKGLMCSSGCTPLYMFYEVQIDRFTNRIYLDLNKGVGIDPLKRPEGTYSQRVDNFGGGVTNKEEDFVHYCDQGTIKFEVPPNTPAGSHTLTVMNDFGYSNTINFQVVPGQGTATEDTTCLNSSATITSIEPSSGPVGTLVTIKGKNLGWMKWGLNGIRNFNTVLFGGVPAEITDFKYETVPATNQLPLVTYPGVQIQARVPNGATTGKIKIIPDIRYGTFGPVFTVTNPEIDSISPLKGPVGTLVTIVGKGFGSATSGASANVVKFGGVQAQVVNVNLERTQIKAQVPQGAVTGLVTVTTPGFPVIRGPVFTVTGEGGGGEGLSVENLFPEEIYLNEENEILIEGEGFDQNTILTSPDQAVSISDVQVSGNGKYLTAVVEVSGSPRSVDLRIANEDQVLTLTREVKTKDPQAPDISTVAVAPTEIQGRVTMEIEGANLDTVTDVALRGAPSLIVENFSKVGNHIVADITVLKFNPNILELIPKALAAEEGDRALLDVKNPSGTDTKIVNLEDFQAAAAQAVSLPDFSKAIDLPAFISSIYSFALTIVGLAVFVRILYAGFIWLTAAGNTTKTGQAKSMMTNAVVGAIILFAAYLILYVINPDLVKNTFDFTIPSE